MSGWFGLLFSLPGVPTQRLAAASSAAVAFFPLLLRLPLEVPSGRALVMLSRSDGCAIKGEEEDEEEDEDDDDDEREAGVDTPRATQAEEEEEEEEEEADNDVGHAPPDADEDRGDANLASREREDERVALFGAPEESTTTSFFSFPSDSSGFVSTDDTGADCTGLRTGGAVCTVRPFVVFSSASSKRNRRISLPDCFQLEAGAAGGGEGVEEEEEEGISMSSPELAPCTTKSFGGERRYSTTRRRETRVG